MIEKVKFDNGLTIITEHVPDVHSASVCVLIETGTAMEKPGNNGISHFAEHLLFKGTETRSAHTIAQSIEDYGGSLNAFTEKEHTSYYARILTEQATLTIDIFCDMLINSVFHPDEIELERQVILEEIKMYEDTPDELVYDHLFKAIWGEHPLSFPVTGCYESVAALQRPHIMKFYKELYTPDNIIFSLAGNFNEQRVEDKIREHFENIKRPGIATNIPDPVMTPSISVQVKDIEQAHLCLATRGISILSDERYPLAVLDIALAGGISSRLFQEIREKRGLAYSINSYKALYRPAGIFGVYAGTSVNNIEEVLKIVINELAIVRENGLSEEELIRAKKQLKGSMLLGLESMYYRAYRNAHSETYFNRVLSIEDICKQIDLITTEDVKILADFLFDTDYYALSVVGPKNMPQDIKIPAPS